MKRFAALAMLLTVAFSAQAEEVDTVLVLSTDVSNSIWDPTLGRSNDPVELNEFKLQKEGIMEALRSKEVAEAITNCNPRGVAITYVEWSGDSEMQAKQVVGWRKVSGPDELISLAQEIGAAPRSYRHSTDLILGLGYSAQLIENAPFTANRRIIDVSSDGVPNMFGWQNMDETSFVGKLERLDGGIKGVRDQIVKMGITINALTIEGEDLPIFVESLRKYYEQNVIGGSGAFVQPINSFGDYGPALTKKLTQELCPFTS